ncbi:ABC transporter permease subunit [Alkalicoccus urumqiensis]|uniref:ABC transporter permease n=1 Tax=Alkalicoccus urumqiensis TaxID=1548213 RepID=A0A2P6MGF2_ALKUR|nr:ABC transporter permease subunit [Alkalicoccus urumqiensis]PRO65368.1 hypothetical protein C6I21_09400 [Alkalicoccus urumqiensis]
MINLVKNEWMKLIHRRFTWIAVALVVLAAFGTSYISNAVTEPVAPEEALSALEQQAESNEMPPENRERAEELSFYHENTGTYPLLESTHAFTYVLEGAGSLAFITMFTVIAGAAVTASEHTTGTIKLLAASPVARWKILLSKLSAIAAYGLLLTIVFALSQLGAGILFHGFSIPSPEVIQWVDGMIRAVSLPVYLGITYGLAYVEMMIFTVIAFTLGTLFKSQAPAVAFSLVLLFMGPQLVFLASAYDWAFYVLFAHTSLLTLFQGQPMIDGTSWWQSAGILFLYVSILLGTTFAVFHKRDITD